MSWIPFYLYSHLSFSGFWVIGIFLLSSLIGSCFLFLVEQSKVVFHRFFKLKNKKANKDFFVFENIYIYI